ncbi:UNVERIFIED_CONTAM: MFS transporter, partial [Escherichia coli]
AMLFLMVLFFHVLVVNFVVWMIFCGVVGFLFVGSYMIIESWLNECVTNELCGRIFLIYMIIIMFGLFCGQYILLFG